MDALCSSVRQSCSSGLTGNGIEIQEAAKRLAEQHLKETHDGCLDFVDNKIFELKSMHVYCKC